MILDCIDAADMLDIIGGDPQGILAVLADALTGDGGTLDPWIGVRLAASRCGQTIFDHLPNIDTLSVMMQEGIPWSARRIIPHLVSPGWETAPPHLRDWWVRTFTQVATSFFSYLLDNPPPLYSTVIPQAAVNRPTANLVIRALAHRKWGTLPDADRRACLGTVYRSVFPDHIVAMIPHAATDIARHDIWQTAVALHMLSEKRNHAYQQLIDPSNDQSEPRAVSDTIAPS